MQKQQQAAAPPQREMEGQGEGMKSMMTTQVSLRDLHQHQHQHQHHNQNGHFHDSQHSQPQTQDDDFMEQMLSTINPDCANSWPPPHSHSRSHALLKSNAHSPDPSQDPDAFAYPFNPATTGDGGGDNSSSSSSSKLRHPSASASPKSSFFLHQHLLLSHSPAPSSDSPAPLLPTLPLTLAPSDAVHPSPQQGQGGEDGSVPALYNGFVGSLHANAQPPSHHHQQQQHFHHPSQDQGGIGKNYGGQATAMMNPDQTPAPPTSASTGGSSGAPQRQRVRARRGQATDPHSIAERLRRERIAERMKALQELVPNANKTDKASMLDEIIDYVKFLQLQVKVLSMSRLGGAAAVAPLGADMSSEGGGGLARNSNGNNNSNGNQANESMTVTEHQVAKLMEEDMGSAMQYLQGKGLCLMPISLATAISTATCQSTRNPLTPTRPGPHINGVANANVNANDSTNTNTNPQLNMNINMSSSASADQLPSIKDNIVNNPSSTSTKP